MHYYLKAITLRTLRPGHHADGGGLYLAVSPNGIGRSWVFRTRKGGRLREIGLGSLDTVTLVWDDGRWLVASRTSAPDSKTPVPAWTSGTPRDSTSEAFDTRLAGMSAPYYRGVTP